MAKYYKYLVLIFCGISLFFSTNLFAQTDTVFWFAAPYQTMHDNLGWFIDRPIVLRFITENQPANIHVSQPANGGMPPFALNIPAHTTQTVNISEWLNSIQNNPPNSVLNYGIKITSDVPIAAYYQIVSDSLSNGTINPPDNRDNPETFSLKGAEALGERFLIPFQNEYDNDTISIPSDRRNCFVVVASENNTKVTITPSFNVVGHLAGVPFNINLNKGQTYSATSVDATAAHHLIGSVVTSDKPIAITVYDDFMRLLDGSDNGGDQIVPQGRLGTEYIVLNGFLAQFPSNYGSLGDDVFITAATDNTAITVNGVFATNLNLGQTYHINMANVDAAFIKSSKPVALWQISGVSNQNGATIVPKLSCAGSQSVSYARTLAGTILFNVVVPNGGQNGFSINGNANTLTGSMFSPVPGTNGNWLYCRLNLQDQGATIYPVGSIIKITNTATKFQLSVVEGSQPASAVSVWGATVGYFTSYGGIDTINTDSNILGSDTALCAGDTLTLNAATAGASSYLWNTGDTTASIIIDSPGTYWVHIEGDFCGIDDTIHVFLKPGIRGLGPDTTICPGQSITLNAATPGAVGYHWSTGDTTTSIVVDSPGTYWVRVDGDFCNNYDTITIKWRHLPPVNLGDDTTICQGAAITLNSGIAPPETILWSTGAITPSIIVRDSGLYWVKVHYPNCGDVGDTIAVGLVKCNCQLDIPTAFSPNGDGKNDIFKPVFQTGCTFEEYDFRIYNRYGQLIFQTFDPAKGWDGLEFGRHADLDVYMYYLKYKGVLDDKATIRKGDVTLLR